MGKGESIGVLSRRLGSLVDQAAHGIMGDIRGFGAQGGTGPVDVGPGLVTGGLDVPALMVKGRPFGGRGEGLVKEGGGERDDLATIAGATGDDPHRQVAAAFLAIPRPKPRIMLSHKPSLWASMTGSLMFLLQRHSRSAPVAAAGDHSGKPA